jgi:hypothetical protein
MNWNYISGFFDADGSISAISAGKGENKTLQISFHNNELIILKCIQKFIFDELGFKGNISFKKSKNINHQDAYDLKYKYRQAIIVSNKMSLLHPKKVYRIKMYNLIQEKTNRNGKYTFEQKTERNNLLNLFSKHY